MGSDDDEVSLSFANCLNQWLIRSAPGGDHANLHALFAEDWSDLKFEIALQECLNLRRILDQRHSISETQAQAFLWGPRHIGNRHVTRANPPQFFDPVKGRIRTGRNV